MSYLPCCDERTYDTGQTCHTFFLSHDLIFPSRLIGLVTIARNNAHTSLLLERSEGTANHLQCCASTRPPIAGGLRCGTILIGAPGFIEPGSHLLHRWVWLCVCCLFQTLTQHAYRSLYLLNGHRRAYE